MTLTPEERQRIYEEEKARKDAQDKLKQRESAATLTGCFAVAAALALGSFVLVGACVVLFPGEDGAPEQSTVNEKKIMAGAIVALSIDGHSPVFVSANTKVADRVTKLAQAGDTEGLRQLVVADLMYPVKHGTKARVLEVGYLVTEIRLIEGDFSGKSGVVKTVWVQP
jgi:phage-related minor tail protein